MYKGKKIIATIEARMKSTRLPGKVLLPLAGIPTLLLLVRRMRHSRYLDDIVVATTVDKADDAIVKLCEASRITVFRGSELDVLSRVLGAARSAQADIIVEITGDCPLVSGELIDRGIAEFFKKTVAYASNDLEASFPVGLSVQVIPLKVLAQVDSLTNDPIDRAHVSYYIYTHPETFALSKWMAHDDERAPDLRLTLDEEADYKVLSAVFDRFKASAESFTVAEAVAYLRERKDIAILNKQVRQKDANEG